VRAIYHTRAEGGRLSTPGTEPRLTTVAGCGALQPGPARRGQQGRESGSEASL